MEVDMYNITSAWQELLQQFYPIFTTPATGIFLRLISTFQEYPSDLP
jgi:hypothetical protein